MEATEMTEKPGKTWRAASVLLLISSAQLLLAQETIVAIRHGEKPPGGMGQLSCTGINRSLQLPDLLIRRFGRPDEIYAPDPSRRIFDGLHLYSYVRPLATIEPTAISLGMRVNTQIGYSNIKELKKQLTAHRQRSALIFVAWEHSKLNDFAKQMLRSYGKDPSAVPSWPDDDYDRIYIFRISENHGKSDLTFEVDKEGLTGSLKDTCPTVINAARVPGPPNTTAKLP
jgi:hypothetical protein